MIEAPSLERPCILNNLTPSDTYPRKWLDGKMKRLGRVVLEKKLGRPIRSGMIARHLCFTKCCVEPTHLAESTISENALDADVQTTGSRNFCPRGHPKTPENTYEWKSERRPNGRAIKRRCRLCRLAKNQRWRLAQLTEEGR